MEWLLPKEVSDQYEMNISRKNWMSDKDMMSALWINMWTEEWLNEWVNEWLWEARPEQMNAPVDMQWIAEPEMPISM